PRRPSPPRACPPTAGCTAAPRSAPGPWPAPGPVPCSWLVFGVDVDVAVREVGREDLAAGVAHRKVAVDRDLVGGEALVGPGLGIPVDRLAPVEERHTTHGDRQDVEVEPD